MLCVGGTSGQVFQRASKLSGIDARPGLMRDRAVKESEILRFLRDNGLSVTEFHILNTVHYGPHPATRLVRVAASESEGWSGRLPRASQSQCKEALTSLLSKELLQVVDESAIGTIEANLAASPARSPYGLPQTGDIDFTVDGGRLWQKLDSEVFESGGVAQWCSFGELNEADGTFRSEYLGQTEDVVRELFASDRVGNTSEVISIEGPVPIGAWRGYWWDVVHQHGYRMVVVERPAATIE